MVEFVETIFPVKWAKYVSTKNSKDIFFIYGFSIFIAWADERWVKKGTPTNPFNEFFDSNTIGMDDFLKAMDMVYNPLVLFIVVNLLFFLSLTIIWMFVNSKNKISLVPFILPFLILSILSVPINLLEILLFFKGILIPSGVHNLLFIYIIIFYCLILIRINKVSVIQSITLIFSPLLFFGIFFGRTCLMPYLISLS